MLTAGSDDFLPKPEGFSSLAEAVQTTYPVVRQSFEAPSRLTIDVSDLRAPVPALDDLESVGVMTLRKLQALHYVLSPGSRTTADVVIGLAAEIDRALQERTLSMTDPGRRAVLEIFMDKMALQLSSLMTYVEGNVQAVLE